MDTERQLFKEYLLPGQEYNSHIESNERDIRHRFIAATACYPQCVDGSIQYLFSCGATADLFASTYLTIDDDWKWRFHHDIDAIMLDDTLCLQGVDMSTPEQHGGGMFLNKNFLLHTAINIPIGNTSILIVHPAITMAQKLAAYWDGTIQPKDLHDVVGIYKALQKTNLCFTWPKVFLAAISCHRGSQHKLICQRLKLLVETANNLKS